MSDLGESSFNDDGTVANDPYDWRVAALADPGTTGEEVTWELMNEEFPRGHPMREFRMKLWELNYTSHGKTVDEINAEWQDPSKRAVVSLPIVAKVVHATCNRRIGDIVVVDVGQPLCDQCLDENFQEFNRELWPECAHPQPTFPKYRAFRMMGHKLFDKKQKQRSWALAPIFPIDGVPKDEPLWLLSCSDCRTEGREYRIKDHTMATLQQIPVESTSVRWIRIR